MSTPTDSRQADLERRLRAASDAVPSRPVPADAWVELQSRLATRDGRHSRRFLAAAVAVALLFALVGAVALLDDGRHSAGPAAGSEKGDPWASENILGEPVVAETLTLGGQEARHELVLSDTTGKGPSLCDRYVAVDDGSGAGGCTARDAKADEPDVAIDWLSGTTGSGGIHGVVGAVDDRVMKVQVWMDNGDETLVPLHPAGWEGTRAFALTVPDTGPTPQRLVAYSDASGTVLQAVALADQFGGDWLPRTSVCAGDGTTQLPELQGSIVAGPYDARIVAGSTAAEERDACLPLTSLLQGVSAGPRDVVLIVAPEVTRVRIWSRLHHVSASLRPVTRLAGAPWAYAVLHADRDLAPDDEITAVLLLDDSVDAHDDDVSSEAVVSTIHVSDLR